MNAPTTDLTGTGGLHEALTGETPTELSGLAAALFPNDHNFPALNGLDYAMMQVRAFHEAFGHPVADRPTLMDRERMENRAKWMREEIDEFLDPTRHTVVDGMDAMIDLIYFALGTIVELGVMPQPMMDIVHHEGNMTKLHVGEDGVARVVKNDDGKVIKPAGWVAPEPKLAAEVARQELTQPLLGLRA
jgi:predicted HAD superfamily Cof-like phosphohydrolase